MKSRIEAESGVSSIPAVVHLPVPQSGLSGVEMRESAAPEAVGSDHPNFHADFGEPGEAGLVLAEILEVPLSLFLLVLFSLGPFVCPF